MKDEDEGWRDRLKYDVGESALLFQKMFDGGPFGMALVGPDFRLVKVNASLCRLLGYTEEQLTSLKFPEFTHPDDVDKDVRLAQRLFEGEIDFYQIEKRFIKRNREVIWVILSASVIHDEQGKLAYGLGVVEDITQQKQREEVLNQSREWLTAIFEASRDGIVVEQNEIIIFANQSFAHLYGYDNPAELMGSHVSILQAPEDNEQMLEFGRQRLRGEPTPSVYEFKGLRKDGVTVDLEASVSTSIIAGKSYIITVVRDVAERKKLEEQLRQSQKIEAVGRLAGGVAHDFNNLLTAILGYTDLLHNELTGKNLNFLAEIKKAGERAALLTRQLLAFSRKQMLAPQVMDLNAAVTDMQEILRRLIGEDHKLIILSVPNLGSVKADPGQISQVIMNLALNARDAMPDGGSLTIETSNRNITQEEAPRMSLQPGLYVVLSVSDTGCGMDAEVQNHIFEPFFTTKEQGKGTGLGLATVYGIVKQSGGGIWFRSTPGFGTTFEICLPRIEEQVQEDTRPETKTGSPSGSETVLLVEDEEPIRKLVARSLEKLGYRILVAQDGPEALRISKLHSEPIHLLLTDVRMPQMSGLELAQSLKALRSNLKVLYMSGHVEGSDRDQASLAPSGAFLQKPFTQRALASAVREVLDSPGTS